MPNVARTYRAHLREPEYRRMLLANGLIFAAGMAFNFYAIAFATAHASNSVTDIILSNTPVLDMDGFFVYGTLFMAAVGVIIGFAHPKRIPFMLGGLGLFWIIRSLFTMMTHVAPFEASYASDFGPVITSAFFGKDQFFSAHTGMPFLGALAFWHRPRLRNIFLAATAYFAVVVLLGHLHYTIDVASAFFITYGIYHIAIWLFPRSYSLFMAETKEESSGVY